MADLPILSPVMAPEPTLGGHVATKNFVETVRSYVPISGSVGGSATLSSISAVGGVLLVTASGGVNITIPPNSSVAIPIGALLWIRKMGTGNVSIVGGTGVSINWVSGVFTITAQYGDAELHKVGIDTWVGHLN